MSAPPSEGLPKAITITVFESATDNTTDTRFEMSVHLPKAGETLKASSRAKAFKAMMAAQEKRPILLLQFQRNRLRKEHRILPPGYHFA